MLHSSVGVVVGLGYMCYMTLCVCVGGGGGGGRYMCHLVKGEGLHIIPHSYWGSTCAA